METRDGGRDNLVLVLSARPQDDRAIARAMGNAGITTQICCTDELPEEIRNGAGAIVLAEDVLSKATVLALATLINEQPSWSDLPLVILTTPKRDVGAHWQLIQNTPSVRNATFLERPMRVETLTRAVKAALRSRTQQYQLCEQIQERERLLELSETNKRHLLAVLDNTRMAVFFMDDRQRCTYMNVAAESLTGFRLGDTQGRSLHNVVHHTHPDGRPYPLEDCPIDRAFPENEQTEGEEVFVHQDGHFYPVAFTASPIRQKDIIVGTVLEVRDITKQKADTKRLHMLLNELNHRVKNTLATVQSIVLQTMRGEAISDHVKNAIMSRLMALSRSHDLLTERNWVSAPLNDVVIRALAPFGVTTHTSGRFIISGDRFEFHPKAALAIGMGLHELATNAVKYGALSIEDGRVDLSWKLIPDGILRLSWIERGGPRVRKPERTGFGLRLIQQGLAHELAGEARMAFNLDGIVCEIDIPIATALVASKYGALDDERNVLEGSQDSGG